MGTAESIEGPQPYGWLLKDRAALLAEFLQALVADDGLAELVIVGDLFDEWVVPYTDSPLPGPDSPYASQFARIAAAPQNEPIIEALQTLALVPGVTLTYVPGNHDMLAQRDILEALIPGIHTVIAGPGDGVYSRGSVAAEHGSRYCLVNAPDPFDRPGHSLPLGFFVARTQAEGVTTGHPVTKRRYIEVFVDALARMVEGESVTDALFRAMVDEVDTPTRTLQMDGIDRYAGTVDVDAVATAFAGLYDEWDRRHPGNVPALLAALGEEAILFPAAFEQYAIKRMFHSPREHVVVFGHTHQWEIRGVSWSFSGLPTLLKTVYEISSAVRHHDYEVVKRLTEAFDDPGPDAESNFIYVNSGTWIDGDSGVSGVDKPPATFVVVGQGDGRLDVEVREYTGGNPRDSRVLGSRYTLI